MQELSVKLFGSPSVSVDGQVVTFPYRKADALLYYMVFKKKATRSELAELLWADSDTSSAMKNLRHAIYSIRKCLGFDIFSTGQWTALELDPNIPIQCDLYDFYTAGELPDLQGEFLEGFQIQHAALFDEWLSDQRSRLQLQYLKLLLNAERAAFHDGELALAEQYGLKYVQLDPLEESAAVILMEVYSTQKKFRKAIGIYHELYKNLSNELGISPLKETTALYYRIVNDWNASTYKMEDQSSHLLVGKDIALRQLLTMCNSPIAERQVPCVLIEGEAGVGKTYLLDHILNYYDFSGWLVCRSFCYQSEMNSLFSPWNSIMMTLMTETENHQFTIPENYLRAASGLFPCLSAGSGEEYDTFTPNYPLQPNYFAAQEGALLILAAVARQFPVLLIFEDIHWIDKNSLGLLSIFLRRMRNLNVSVICTSRDIYPDHVKEFIDSARRDHILECYPVQRFSRDETAKFLQLHLSKEPTEELISQIYNRTEGNALLLVQLINSLQEMSDLSNIPENLEDIIGYRLANLTPEERQVLDLISVFPDRATFDSLSSILTKDTLELMYICSHLTRRMLVTESTHEGSLSYSLTHEQIQSTLIEQQSETTRRILHLRVAQYLETQLTHTRVPLYDRLVYHFSEGGNRFKVFQYRVLSLNAYTKMYYAVLPTLEDDSEAAWSQDFPDYFSSLEHELAALRADASDSEELLQLEQIFLHAKGCYCVYLGRYDEGLEALNRLIDLCTESGNTLLLVLAHLQLIYYGIQIYDIRVMEQSLNIGLSLLKNQEPSVEYGIYLRMEGLYHTMCGDYVRSRAVLQQSIDFFIGLAPGHDDQYAINIAGAYNYIAESYRLEGAYDQAFLAYDQAIIYNRRHSYYSGVAAFYTNYGVAAFQKGEREIARRLFLYAVETYRISHGYSALPIALSYLAFFESEAGNYSPAAKYIREALQVSDMIGSPWWKGVTLYQCWKIRALLDARGLDMPELRALWPASPIDHCELCLSSLRQLTPRQETQEMEDALRQLKASS